MRLPQSSDLIKRISERTLSHYGISQVYLFPRVWYFHPRRSWSGVGDISPLFSFFSATSIAPIASCGPYFKAGTGVLVSSPGMDVGCSKCFLGQVMCLAFFLHHFMYSSGHLWEVSAVIFDLLLGKQRLNWDVDSGISDSTRH